MGIKNAEFYSDFESVAKLQNIPCKKVTNKKVTEKWSFLLLLLSAKVVCL